MLRIGITGGIGSGKSTVSKIFETLGIPVYYADEAARRIMNESAVIREQLIENFGPAVYDGHLLNRKKLAELVFNNPWRLSLLNQVVHPVTIADAEAWMQQQQAPYAIKEAALIFETDASKHLDLVIGVYAPAPLRIRRVMQRDGISRDEVMARMNKQIDEVIKMRLCDFVLTNDEQQLLIPQVLALHKDLLQRSASK
ncbi:MAG: dephospho-CoA kinase [Ferruginibacter sp.]